MPMFPATALETAKRSERPTCPDRQAPKHTVLYPHNGMGLSLKRETLSHATLWMTLEDVVPRGRNVRHRRTEKQLNPQRQKAGW